MAISLRQLGWYASRVASKLRPKQMSFAFRKGHQFGANPSVFRLGKKYAKAGIGQIKRHPFLFAGGALLGQEAWDVTSGAAYYRLYNRPDERRIRALEREERRERSQGTIAPMRRRRVY